MLNHMGYTTGILNTTFPMMQLDSISSENTPFYNLFNHLIAENIDGAPTHYQPSGVSR